MTAALVLAGGRSRRLGTEKAMASFNDGPLLAAGVKRLVAQGFTVAVNAPPSAAAASWASHGGYAVLSDDPADPVGPLAGLKAGLIWAEALHIEVLVTRPCDTPFLPAQLETVLVASLSEGASAAVARSPSGLQSLCAAWRVDTTLQALQTHFAAGRHPAVHDFLAQLGAVEASFPDDAVFANLNTWDDFAQAEGRSR